MATAMYLEHYLDSLESLPIELNRNFTLMRDLDQRALDALREVDRIADDYLANVRGMVQDKKKEQLDKINKLFGKSKEFGDDKVQLAMQTYEMVDKHIRKLDADLARFEADLKEKSLNSQSDSDVAPKKGRGREKSEKGGKKAGRGRGRMQVSDDETPKMSRKKMKTQQPMPESPIAGALAALPMSITHPSDVLDMPVDPNEPTYCLCHQVSYGEMIGCDNPDCPIEWFHFACVGLTTKPKGKWFCPRCTLERKKKM
ncbi:PREDICTED: inhibitor of growth protein 4-like [Priapulus caudatus]|uniref:Inhibitor of growth protein n=1 Tax=Priapulus caudatus TaxID=37621 RepID=A0ABM1EA84_PRICU|nr:PREDICTED: inhibitor of growth protein 4-like [Priapulus caudatus]